MKTDAHAGAYRRILGIDFFGGTPSAAIDKIREGGLLVVPAAPALKDLDSNLEYRESLLNADLAITDSAFMVIIWNALRSDNLRRLSGLEYLCALLDEEEIRRSGNTLWIMPSRESADRNASWLRQQGIPVPEQNVYVAPFYGSRIEDQELVELVEQLRPRHIVVTLGGGTQERLGLYLKRRLDYLPAIHCIGAAIAFLSGDQVSIPRWADRMYLGWLFRSISDPKRFVPRYWDARKLFSLMLRYRSELPALHPTGSQPGFFPKLPLEPRSRE